MDVHAYSLTSKQEALPSVPTFWSSKAETGGGEQCWLPVQGYFSLDSFTQDQPPILVSFRLHPRTQDEQRT